MSKSIVLSEEAWLKIYNHIAQNYPPSVLLIRDKMRDVLGFTARRHEEWLDSKVDINDVSYGTRWRVFKIHLDFYNEPKRTMFLLKYSEYLDKSGNTTLDIE
jgi:predicted transcriptional regulator